MLAYSLVPQKFSVNPLLAVYFPSSVHVAAFILYGPAEGPEQRATPREVPEVPQLNASYDSRGWSDSWRHNWNHWGTSCRMVHRAQKLVSKQGARNLIALWDDLAACY